MNQYVYINTQLLKIIEREWNEMEKNTHTSLLKNYNVNTCEYLNISLLDLPMTNTLIRSYTWDLFPWFLLS